MSANADTRDLDSLQIDRLGMTIAIVSAFLANNRVEPTELTALISSVHHAIGGLGRAAAPEPAPVAKPTPAQVRKSITPDALISFLDGRPYKTLKRHLATHGLDIAGYRERFGLPADYPATAPSYSERRAALARDQGLGQMRSSRGRQAGPGEGRGA